jgi:hypothetical protein
MKYYIYLFSPETFEAFTESDLSVAGVRSKQEGTASKFEVGDKLICYVTKLSRWIGTLSVSGGLFKDEKPLFNSANDPFIIRFNVKPIVWLSIEAGIPIHEEICWNNLSFTKELPKRSLQWTPMVRTSLRRLNEVDGAYLERILRQQSDSPMAYPLSEVDKLKLKPKL